MKKDKKEEKNNKYKELYLKFKEAWKVPRKRAGIKLLGYFVFFFIFAIMVRVASNMQFEDISEKENKEVEIKENLESFREKQNSLLDTEHNVNYEIKIGDLVYKINGDIKDNVIKGYLESNDGIKKVILKDNLLNDVTNGSEELLDLGLEMSKLDINYLVSIMKHNDAYIEDKDGIKSYQYAININDNENTMVVYTNEKTIEKIVITDLSSEYILIFDK